MHIHKLTHSHSHSHIHTLTHTLSLKQPAMSRKNAHLHAWETRYWSQIDVDWIQMVLGLFLSCQYGLTVRTPTECCVSGNLCFVFAILVCRYNFSDNCYIRLG